MAVIYRSNIYGFNDINDNNALRNCKVFTKYSLEQLVMLTGIEAIHDVTDVIRDASITIEANNQEAGVYIQTKALNIKIRIATNTETTFKEKIIEGLFIRLFPPYNKKGWGSAIFLAQTIIAANLGFKKITSEPYGNKETLKELDIKKQYNGYFTWARLGFTMDQKSSREYEKKLTGHGITPIPLHNLLKKKILLVRISENKTVSMTGKKYWQEHGGEWKGEFDLDPNSLNNAILLGYLKGKNPILRILHFLRKIKKKVAVR